jgi:hypothetical protein
MRFGSAFVAGELPVPAQVVPSAPGVPASRYSVVGMYSEEAGSRFVCHLALLREDGRLTYGATSQVWDMAPPLVAGEQSRHKAGRDAACEAHLVGWVDLTAEEQEGVTDWLAEVDKQDRPLGQREKWKQYTLSLDPRDEWHRDERGVPIFRRFSCVTFVMSAYQEGAGVRLLDVSNPARLPEVELETVARAYGDEVRRLARLRAIIGIPGDGPWRIVLAGYVLHALHRPEEHIRQAGHTVTGLAESEFPFPLAPTTAAPPPMPPGS